MAKWDFTVALDRSAGTPLFLQIARAITTDIRRGRLRPGDPLPGSRTLARIVGVQRGTVLAALDELVAEGWLVASPARGTFVSPELPEQRPRRLEGGCRTRLPKRFVLGASGARSVELPYVIPRGGLFFAPNRPDPRLVPRDLIGRAYRRALRRNGSILLGYGRPWGHERLRVAIAEMLSSTRALAASPDDVLITRGSQMAIALLARALLRRGDSVAVEALCHPPAIEVFRREGATVVPIPLDGDGMLVDRLEQVARTGKLRMVYVTPHHQFPTTVTLSASRRLRLLELARRHRFAILEEDYDHEFHFDGHPILPLAASDREGVVAYVGTFSKVLAPALRMGYVVAPRPLLNALAALRLHLDVQGDRVLEFALAELMEQGEVQRHIQRTRREYRARRDALVAALRRELPHALEFTVPAGGIGLWVRAVGGVDIDAWAHRAHQRGAVIVTARSLSVSRRPRPFARLGFAALDPEELVEGVRRLAVSLPG